MLCLGAATQAVAAAAVGAAAAAGEHGNGHAETPAFHTGSWISPLYDTFHLLDRNVLPEEVFISLIMAFVIGLTCYLFTRRLDLRRPSKTQAALELVVSSLNSMVTGLIGPEGRRFLPMIATLFIYILVLNLSGLIPLWKSPTSNLHVPLALAICTFLYVQYHGIRANGLFGYVRHFWGEPVWLGPLNIIIHIIGELARPISLCFRLFGNIFGEDVVIAILLMLSASFFFPAQAFMYPLAVFTSFLQAMVFTMLTCIYIAGFVVHEDHGHEHAHGEEHPVIETRMPASPA